MILAPLRVRADPVDGVPEETEEKERMEIFLNR